MTPSADQRTILYAILNGPALSGGFGEIGSGAAGGAGEFGAGMGMKGLELSLPAG